MPLLKVVFNIRNVVAKFPGETGAKIGVQDLPPPARRGGGGLRLVSFRGDRGVRIELEKGRPRASLARPRRRFRVACSVLAGPFMNEEVTKRVLPDEIADLVIQIAMVEEEITSVVRPCELIDPTDDDVELEDELEILESWPIEGE